MARARSGGGGAAFAWALVVFGTGFFLFLILFIVSSTQVSEARDQQVEAEEALDQYASRVQRESQDVLSIVGDLKGGETVVQRLLEDNIALKRMISGSGDTTVAALAEQKTQKDIDAALIPAIEDLRAQMDQLREQVAAAEKARSDAQARAQSAEQSLARLDDQFKEAKAELATQFTGTSTKFEQVVGNYDTMAADLRSEMQETRGQMQEVVNQKEATIEELRAENARLRIQIQRIIDERATTTLSDVIPADGRIVSLVPDQDKVYINRGSEDHLQLGMAFEVFGEDELVELDEYEEVRGKATIEVISIEDNTAVTRIVRRSRGATISPNDKIVNLIYDPNTVFKFFVYGEFDIDSSGEPTTRDRDRIRSMISRWGGKNADDLNWDVDFLVLGKEPPVPEPLDPDEIDPTVIRQHADATRIYETYQNLVVEAKALSIPVLNQNRFLSLVGYYQR